MEIVKRIIIINDPREIQSDLYMPETLNKEISERSSNTQDNPGIGCRNAFTFKISFYVSHCFPNLILA